MKIFLDTSNIDEIKTALSWGILDGITTNPSLAAKEGKEFEPMIREILQTVPGPVSVETTSLIATEIVREGKEFATWGKNVVVKVPIFPEGLKAIKQLADDGIKVNTTLIFSVPQAILAAKAGAWCVSPFIGRLDDHGENGMDLIRDLTKIFRSYGFSTQILAASIRHPVHVVESAEAGADIATMPFKVLQQMFTHPLTDIGMKRFLDDWEKVKALHKVKVSG